MRTVVARRRRRTDLYDGKRIRSALLWPSCLGIVLLLMHATGPVSLADVRPDERPTSTVRICSDYDSPSDRDLLPILIFVEQSYLHVHKTVSSPVRPQLYIRDCSSSDFGITWDGWGGSWGTGSKVNLTVGMHRAGDQTLRVYEDWYLGEEKLEGPWSGARPTWQSNATNPSVAYSLSSPRFTGMAFRRPAPGGSSVLFTKSEDASNNYRNWTTPFALALGPVGQAPRDEMPAIAIDPLDRVHLAYLRSDPAGRRDVYYVRNNDRGNDGAWESELWIRLSSTTTDNHDLVIAASPAGQSVLAVWTATRASGDEDLMYAYSRDGGATWRSARTLSATASSEGYPAISVDPLTSSFHLAWWRGGSAQGGTNDIQFARASGGDPGNWTNPQSVVDAAAVVSSEYPRPAIASGWRGGNNIVNIAWTDERNGDEDLYMTDLDFPVECAATAAPTSGVAPLSVVFGSNASGGLPPYTYSWQFGDGVTASGPAPAHTYSQAGVYGAALQVTDVAGDICFDTIQIDVLSQIPDLAVRPTDVATSTPPYVEGRPMWINGTIRNLGGGFVTNATARLALGAPGGPSLGNRTGLSIPAMGNVSVSLPWTPPSAGESTVCVVVDPEDVIAESDEGNNAACVPFYVLALPDLAFFPGDVAADPLSVPIGGVINLTGVLRNLGESAVAEVSLTFFRDGNGDRIPDPSEAFDAQAVPSVAGRADTTLVSTWGADRVGFQALCAYVDPEDSVPEGDETNNVECAVVEVPGPPDYVPWNPIPSSPTIVGLSRPVAFSLDVRNTGGAPANVTTRLVFFDASTPSIPFAWFDVPPIGESGTVGPWEVSWLSPAIPGSYAIGAVVDAGDAVSEWDESNNGYTWAVGVVAAPVTTLSVGHPSVIAAQSYVTSGTTFSLSAIDPGGTGIRRTEYRVDDGRWIDYSATGPFRLSAEGGRIIEWRSEDNVGNAEPVQAASFSVDDTPPTTMIEIGDPKHLAAKTFVTSETPLMITAVDGGETPVGPAASEHRTDGGPWIPYSAPFFLAGEGSHVVEYSSTDRLGNREAVRSATVIVDDSPPAITVDVGIPRYDGAEQYVTSAAPIALSAIDVGPAPVGLAFVEHRQGGGWSTYGGQFTIAGPDGPKTVEYRATDLLGNGFAAQLDLVVDDTPPVTTASHGDGTYLIGTQTGFEAWDAGSGIARTEYRVDGGSWAVYGGPVTVPEGTHAIGYRSTDLLDNEEPERVLVVRIEGAPPSAPGTNGKPFVAAVFSAVLALVGTWSARRTPSRIGPRPRLRAFAFTALPFVATEAGTGVVSLLTGLLSIPPLVGPGTAVDLAILVAGVAVSVYRVRKRNAKGREGEPVI